jgi:hypothetical protein
MKLIVLGSGRGAGELDGERRAADGGAFDGCVKNLGLPERFFRLK